MSQEEKILWLRVSLSKGIGPVTFWNLLKSANGSIEAVFDHIKDPYPENLAEKELIEHEKQGFQLIAACEEAFPQSFRLMRDCPPLISAAGNIELLNQTAIAMVGARNASTLGKIFAHKMAHCFSENHLITVSGMARGIDASVHEGSIEHGTIAVLAGGLDVIYPSENAALYKAIMERGVLISEMPLHTPIDASLFPKRNRLIAGITNWVVLIEAAIQSGSLITAKYALDQGKEVFSVPGFPSDPRSRGCNLLIKQGATLVESAEDVLLAIRSDLSIIKSKFDDHNPAYSVQNSCEDEEEDLKQVILSSLGTLPISIEALFQMQNCSLPHLLSILSDLETEGKIQRHPNSDVSLKYMG